MTIHAGKAAPAPGVTKEHPETKKHMITEPFIKDILLTAGITGISGIIVKDDKVFITIEIANKNLKDSSHIENSIHDALASKVHKDNIKLIFTNQNPAPSGKTKHYIDGIGKVILVSSGKGGVGKSTMATSLAETYQKEGYKVGLIDADIYGPSIPTMFGINTKPEIINQKFTPLEARGIKLMSVGFLVDTEVPIAWRGPMASKVLYQMLSTTDWGDIDYLIVDMPPGTGDVHLSILENYHIDGVVIVTTPQNISMSDVERSIRLYCKFEVPILAIIENMSDIFPGNAGDILAQKYKIKHLEKVIFDREIAEQSDNGQYVGNILKLPLN
jgi:ATP-binding protein involved in chromosome partitioning